MTHVPIPIPFGRIIKLWSRGQDTQGVQRALARAGYGVLGGLLPVLGPKAYSNLRAFQSFNRLKVDGIYGPQTHAKLSKWFDDYAFLLYTGKQPHPPVELLRLPVTFTPTHQTAGLPVPGALPGTIESFSYPAVDVFAKPGTTVIAPEDGHVRRLSGKDPVLGGVQGGAYGWSIYLETATGIYFLTHFGTRTVFLGELVKRGEKLGTVCDAKVAQMKSDVSHIHCGKHVTGGV